LVTATKEVQDAGADTGRLMTVFKVKLESTKKIDNADVVVGIDKAGVSSGPLAIVKTQDPNITHPLRQKEVLEGIGTLHGQRFTSHVFQALVWKHDLKNKPQYCWKATEGVLTRYSQDIVAWIRGLSAQQVQHALADYKLHCGKTRVRNRNAKCA
jgi:hypothetical protein